MPLSIKLLIAGIAVPGLRSSVCEAETTMKLSYEASAGKWEWKRAHFTWHSFWTISSLAATIFSPILDIPSHIGTGSSHTRSLLLLHLLQLDDR
jgi:hypothetical protein